ESISTAKLFSLANVNTVPLVVLDHDNLATELPGLNLANNISSDIANAINQGMTVTIPKLETLHEDWLGTGYLKENPTTGEAGWMLSGMIAGGMTALNPDRWPDNYYEPLANPFQEEVNRNPDAVVELKVLAPSEGQQGTVGKALLQPLQVVALDNTGRHVAGVEVSFEVKAGGGLLSQASAYTDANGIAQVEFTPGTDISANPTLLYASPHSQLVGENLIDVYTPGGIRIAQPITAFAFPDIPDHIEITSGGNTGPILTWADTIAVMVEDQYHNSISNKDVVFAMGAAVPKSSCQLANVDDRSGLLIKISDTCLDNNIPVYGDCGVNSIIVSTSDIGAAAQVILGGVPDASYPVSIQVDGLPGKTVQVTSLPFGNCDGDSPPQHDLVLKDINLADNYGNIINAAPVGGTIPVTARMYAVSELGEIIEKSIDCIPSGADTCPMLIGTRQYDIDTSFTSSTVTFGQHASTDIGEGIFEMKKFPVGDSPAKKTITITGTASKMVQETVNACSSQDDCQLVETEYTFSEISITKEVYAVDISFVDTQLVIPINADGYATADTVIDYTILPESYVAGNAMVDFAKKLADGQYQTISYLESERSGNGFVTLARGFRFESDTEYVARVVLNRGSNTTEIVSREITLRPIALDLRADLNLDGLYLEDDTQETLGLGLVVPLNNDDDDGDYVIDEIDDSLQAADGTLVVDNDLIAVRLISLPEETNQGTVTVEIAQGIDKVRIWTDPTKGAGSLLLDGLADPFTVRKSWSLGTPDVPSFGQLPKTLYIEGIDASLNKDDFVAVVIKFQPGSNLSSEIEMDRLRVMVMQTALVPDYNRDGIIDEEDRGKVNDLQPWRFWVNDDDDMDSAPLTGLSTDLPVGATPDDLPGQNEDNGDNIINGIRDMVDFFPLYLDIHKILQFWKWDDGFDYRLSNADDALGLFIPIYQGSFPALNNVAAYLEDPETAQSLVSSQGQTIPVEAVTKEGLPLSGFLLSSIAASDQNGVVLLEARKSTNNPLVLEIMKEGAVVYRVEFPLEILPVEQMFGHKNLRSVAGAADGDPDRFVDFTDQNSPEYFSKAKQPYCMQGADKNLVWMHGYNVGPEAAKATYAEVFKRFFHAGFNGRFYGVSWFGDPPAPGTKHYHQAAVNAFATAKTYADFINSVPGSSSLAAHSFGNLVVGSAIQDHGLTNFAKYFAIDASIALEAYGQFVDVSTYVNLNGTLTTDPNAGMVNVNGWPTYIAGGQSRLLASEWYKLFEGTDDNRKELTWRNRLSGVVSDKVYNFYSSTEEVLRRYDDDNIFFDGNGLSLEALYISTWVKQEKFKGRQDVVNFADNIGGVSSPYGGWSFNPVWWIEDPSTISTGLEWMKMPPENAKAITKEELRKKPFFDLRVDWLVSDDPTDTSPSEFVVKKIRYTGLTNYYKDNEAAHWLVSVRDWMLAEAIPATTLPMGANENTKFLGNNIDMSGGPSGKGVCCKTDETLWPRIKTYQNAREWRHSDYKDVSYQHVYKFYKKIINN
ncbi:MAG: Ig-like domain-containing protein, partial [Thermodesulfobacteriota bacterium]